MPGTSESRSANDAEFAASVAHALEWDAYVPVEGIRVTAVERWVTLEGEVEWEYQRRDAERVVQRLLGARGVTNRIQVKPRLAPARVRRLIERRLADSARLGGARIGVEVRRGEVSLRGRVRSRREHDEAERIAWASPAVTDVRNLIAVGDERELAERTARNVHHDGPPTRSISMTIPASNALAPDFALPDANQQIVKLGDYRGKRVVLAFYPADWSPVCTSELALIQETLDDIRGYDAELLALSCDGPFSHRAWADNQHLTFPLLSDFWPHGEVSRRYGVFLPQEGFSNRALFFIDESGALRGHWIAENPGVAPGLNLIFEALEQMAGSRGARARSTTAPREAHHG